MVTTPSQQPHYAELCREYNIEHVQHSNCVRGRVLDYNAFTPEGLKLEKPQVRDLEIGSIEGFLNNNCT